MVRARKKTATHTSLTDTETLLPGATDFDIEEYESAAHGMEASPARLRRRPPSRRERRSPEADSCGPYAIGQAPRGLQSREGRSQRPPAKGHQD
jgi:hypothetical protein